uniref:CxxxxCH/CxxCH domain-containing protein n=1 Tax=Bifidobacterium callitrichos TaxID=762209 RepID=UPI0035937487
MDSLTSPRRAGIRRCGGVRCHFAGAGSGPSTPRSSDSCPRWSRTLRTRGRSSSGTASGR